MALAPKDNFYTNFHHNGPLVHFIAIGGIGMQALARYARKQGWRVQGSDLEHSQAIEILKKEGIPCVVGHKESNIVDMNHHVADYDGHDAMDSSHGDISFFPHVVVYSSAVKPTNPEYQKAKAKGIPLLKRSDFLRCCIAHIQGPHGDLELSSILKSCVELFPLKNQEKQFSDHQQIDLNDILDKKDPMMPNHIPSSCKNSTHENFSPRVHHPLLMVAGTHGKTTTTALLTHILHHGGKNPLGFIGGKTQEDYLVFQCQAIVVEGDESDGSHTNIGPVDGLIVTNLDDDHLDNYENDKAILQESFKTLGKKSHFLALCSQDEGLQEIFSPQHTTKEAQGFYEGEKMNTKDLENLRGYFFYGLEEKTPWGTPHDIYATNLWQDTKGQYMDIYIHKKFLQITNSEDPHSTNHGDNSRVLLNDQGFSHHNHCNNNHNPHVLYGKNIFLPLWGHHNILNALGTLLLAHGVAKIPQKTIVEALGTFSGVERRMTHGGTFNSIPIVDDYAHHPREIRALGQAIGQRGFQKPLAIFEPHRYTRFNQYFQDFLHCFDNFAGLVILPLYGAHQNSTGLSSGDFFRHFQDLFPHKPVFLAQGPEDLPYFCLRDSWDVLVFMGAGHSSAYSHNLKNTCLQSRSKPS